MAGTPQPPDLGGQVAIVTGASRGIGKGIALGLAEAGAAVVCAARTLHDGEQPEGLPGSVTRTVHEIEDAGGRALAVRCDIGDDEDVAGLIDAAHDAFGRIDVLVNNAMTPTQGRFEESTVEDWDTSMRINVRSLFVLCKAVLPRMREAGGGSIINISSGAADPYVQGMPPGFLTYSVAKAALERFSTALAVELAEHDVAVNAFRPGAVKTETSVHELGEDFDFSGWSTPDSVVPAIRFLAAQRADGLTGRIVDVSGFGDRWP